jgi:hypothetical protein
LRCRFSGELGRFAVQRVASNADAAEESRQTLLGALLRPIERRSLWVGVDQRDGLALPRSDAFGADGGTRTRTALRPRDFKSLASTGFATSAFSARFFHTSPRK